MNLETQTEIQNQKPTLSVSERKLIFCHSMMVGACAFGIYLVSKWTLDSNGGNLLELIFQYIMQLIPGLVGYFLVIRFCDKLKLNIFFALAFVVLALAYTLFLVLALLGNTIAANLIFGAMLGFGLGMFWSCCNNMSISFINRNRRGRFFGITGMWSQSIRAIAPFIMLCFVLGFHGNQQVPFSVFLSFYIILMCCLLLAFVVCLTIDIPKYKEKFTLKGLFAEKKQGHWKQYLGINYLYGTSISVADTLNGVYILALSVYDNYVYLLMMVVSLSLSVVSNYLFAKPFFGKNRDKVYYLCLAVTSVIYIAIVLLYDLSFGGIVAIVVLILAAIFNVTRLQCENVLHNGGMLEFAQQDAQLSKGFFIREVIIVLGRLTTATTLICLSVLGEKISLTITVSLAMILSSVFAFYLTKKYFKDILVA